MGLLSKTKQRITISGDDKAALETVASGLRARNLKDAKVSSIKHVADEWQFVVNCNRAEVVYYKEILPLLYDSAATQSLQVLLEFSDENELVKRCPLEILASFSLPSRYAFGDKTEQEFILKMHKAISQYPPDNPAAVTYCIVSRGDVTICVPCADTEAMAQYVKNKLSALKIKQYMINVVDRRSGTVQSSDEGTAIDNDDMSRGTATNVKKFDIRFLALYIIGTGVISLICYYFLDGQLKPGWVVRHILLGAMGGTALYLWDLRKARKKAN